MRYLYCYDITKPKRLQKVAKQLVNNGIRIQRSFFMCEFETAEEASQLFSELQQLLNLREDSLFLYPICTKCQKKTLMVGEGIFEIMQEYRIL
jgi:CRISPR-associated protein Cas2